MQLHPEVTHWVVLDDLDLTWDDSSVETPEVMAARFVQTDPDQGMTAQDAGRALSILAEPFKLALPRPRRESEVLKAPAIDALADGMASCNVEGQSSVSVQGYSGF